jgi:ParB-like chromosome segregation protein Spo0J
MMNIIYKKTADLKPYEKNPRTIGKEAISAVAESISEFGFKVPILITSNDVIIAGHTRLQAAKKLKLKEVPCIYCNDLTQEQIAALRLADNKTSELSSWDSDLLNDEISEILNIDMSKFGFEDLKSGIETEAAERESIEFEETVSVVVECENDSEAEAVFNQLTKEGYKCRISTL